MPVPSSSPCAPSGHSFAERENLTRRCRALPPTETARDDDFAQINHTLPQPSVLVEQFVDARIIRCHPFACCGAAVVRDEPWFWSLVCHGHPSCEAAGTIEPPANRCWRSMQAPTSSANQFIQRRNPDGEFCRKFVCSVTFASRGRPEALKVGWTTGPGEALWKAGASGRNEKMRDDGQAFAKSGVAQ